MIRIYYNMGVEKSIEHMQYKLQKYNPAKKA